jgi:hypothetical protein
LDAREDALDEFWADEFRDPAADDFREVEAEEFLE